jgi:hypothetical protein
MKNISKWAIDKEKFVFDVKNGNNHVILTEYAHVCSHYLSELPKVLKKYAWLFIYLNIEIADLFKLNVRHVISVY